MGPYSNHTHITSADANSSVVVSTLNGATLGKITINKTSAHALTVYDADDATELGPVIAVIKASIAEQTLDYCVNVHKGIIIAVPSSYDGDVTVSHR